MPTQTAPRKPLADLTRRDTAPVVRRITGRTPVVAPLEVAAFSSSL